MQKLIFLFLSFIFTQIWALDTAIVSIYAVNTKTHKVILDQNSHLSLVPASCMKLVTTGAALHLLGADFRFQTQLEYSGTIDEDGTLKGNIYIRGGGDPCLGSGRIAGSLPWQLQIDQFAKSIEALGIRQIQGTIFADTSRWEKIRAVPSWACEDVGNYYGSGASALSFHENAYTLVFQPGSQVGALTSILRTDPPISSLVLHNEVLTGLPQSGDEACIYGSEGSSIQFARGTIPSGVAEFSIRGAIPEPDALCVNLLMHQLEKQGIKVAQKSYPHAERKVFYTILSPPLKDIVYWANQKSINLYAEHLLKEIGKQIAQEGSTPAGAKAVKDFWQSQGIDLQGMHVEDGSGLSRKNLITTKQLVTLLQKNA